MGCTFLFTSRRTYNPGFISGGGAVYGTLLGPTKTQPYKLYRCNLDRITYLHLGVRNHE